MSMEIWPGVSRVIMNEESLKVQDVEETRNW